MRKKAWNTRVVPFVFCVLLACPPDVMAAPAREAAHTSESLFITQIIVLLLVGRLLGEFMLRIGQPAVMGKLLAGILLGPSVFGGLWPETQQAVFGGGPEQKAMLEAISILGILMLLLLTGMETDLQLVKRARKPALIISITGIIIPFVCGFALGESFPDVLLPRPDQRFITSLFLGTALAVASIKIVAAVIREMNFLRRKIGITLIASAIIDDTVGWTIIAITSGLAMHQLNVMTIVHSVLGTFLFLALSFTIGRRIVFKIIRFTNDAFVSEVPVVTAILIIMGGMALITHSIGVHTVLGAFVTGILIGESPILTRHIEEQLRGLVTALFAPVFFTLAGFHANLAFLKDPTLFMLTLLLIAIASVGKFAGAFLGGAMAGLTRRESFALGCGMNARGSTEVIIASIGLSLGVINEQLFTMIVAMAIVTTLAMPPMLRWALARLPVDEEEQSRLDREAFEAAGFVTNVERLLVAVDDSPNGKLALHLASSIAQSQGITTTVLQIMPGNPQDSAQALPEALSSNAHVTLRSETTPAEAAIEKEVRKRYDLVVLGIANALAPTGGGFHPDVTHIAHVHRGSIAVVVARGAYDRILETSALNILIPVRHKKASRSAAEVALAMSQAQSSQLTAVHVLSTIGLGAILRLKRLLAKRHFKEEVFKDISDLAKRHGRSIQTSLRLDVAVEDAILKEAQAADYNLIVMGVDNADGAVLFGKVAIAVLENASQSMLFLSC